MRRRLQIYALTVVTNQRFRLFQRSANAQLLLDTILRHRELGRMLVHGFAIMPDHLHLLLTPTESIEKAVQLVKGGFSFAAREDCKGEIWQEGYHAHRCVDAADYRAQLSYIVANPTRKGWEDYPWVHTNAGLMLDPAPTSF